MITPTRNVARDYSKYFRDLVVNAGSTLSCKQNPPSKYLHHRGNMRAWVVSWNCAAVGCCTSAVDAQVVVRSLETRGCHGSTVVEVRMNAETATGQALLADPG